MPRPHPYDLARACYARAKAAATPADRDAWIRRGAMAEADALAGMAVEDWPATPAWRPRAPWARLLAR